MKGSARAIERMRGPAIERRAPSRIARAARVVKRNEGVKR
ncbi:hypothetical protein BURPS305_4649 [Burkholderia pseudomallei 305]|nr:putative endoribonuclease L-PSP [Burkholderia pseudomallei 668]ARK97784.1 endoribonuclease [Burkholderia pseudomallei]EBA49219.1 hypothetical protein BURPS305_4649 [Burkholderia pseudomallei 305]